MNYTEWIGYAAASLTRSDCQRDHVSLGCQYFVDAGMVWERPK